MKQSPENLNKKILVYTFYNWNALTCKVLREIDIPDIDKLYIRGVGGPNQLVNKVSKGNYGYVIGLGDYRKDAKKIRVEGVFLNKYGKNEIMDGEILTYNGSLKIKLQDDMIISNKPSWGPCNRSAYVLADYIKKQKIDCEIDFIHIPRKLDKDYIISVIETIVRNAVLL